MYPGYPGHIVGCFLGGDRPAVERDRSGLERPPNYRLWCTGGGAPPFELEPARLSTHSLPVRRAQVPSRPMMWTQKGPPRRLRARQPPSGPRGLRGKLARLRDLSITEAFREAVESAIVRTEDPRGRWDRTADKASSVVLHIKDEATSQSARELAAANGMTLTPAVRMACDEALERHTQPTPPEKPLEERLEPLHRRLGSLPRPPITTQHSDE